MNGTDRTLESGSDALVVTVDEAEALFDRAPCGYLATTPDGVIVTVNEALLALTGYDRAALLGRRFVELLTGGGRIYHETHYAPLLRMHGTARGIALDLVRADGERVPVLVNSVLETDAHGRAVGTRTAIFDATERRAYERELLAAKRRAEESERRSRSLARTLQQTLIPPAPPEIPGLDIAAVYRPAGNGEEVGGDFYDVFEIAEDDWAVVVGDVRGKGTEAAVVTALIRYTLRAASVRDPRPSASLRHLNDVMLRDGVDRFATVVLGRLRRAGGRWTATLSCGGHPLPLLSRAGFRPALIGSPGTLLGVLADPDLHDNRVELNPGDVIVLYTDGVTEGRRTDVFFDDDGLSRSVSRNAGSARSVADGILGDVLNFQDGVPRDDIAIVAFRVP
ncbi:MAG: phosphoserine phosphatase RsbU/P [Frankiaceae bacterium]|jgi:sigma-B regulation protein RsbU (phosphoserine phosphatase)|nr:phosphoserine phosphatase RsbU/P [Frankiaceae bacterium]